MKQKRYGELQVFPNKIGNIKYYSWPFLKNRLHWLKDMTGVHISVDELHQKLESATVYWFNELGQIFEKDMNPVDKKSAMLKMVELDYADKDNNRLYAWMAKDKDGSYKNICFGTFGELGKALASMFYNAKDSIAVNNQ